MYATVRNYAGTPGFIDGLVSNESEVKRVVREISGFRAYYMISTDGGGAVSVSVYDDQAGAEASNKVAGEWIAANLPDLKVGAPQVSAGEVVITV